MNSFLFIIPVTPNQFLNEDRANLQQLCVKHLRNQSYENWKVLWISKDFPLTDDKRFIQINYEGTKEEKLQVATRYILEYKVDADYIIRLDDDDLFNPGLLNKIKDDSFDVMVDKHQVFWFYRTQYYASRVWYWFPNTCIHKREHALAKFGMLANNNIPQLNEKVLLIENDHSKIHTYYKRKNIRFSEKHNPIYIRTITDSSITSKNSTDIVAYYSNFGNWKKKLYPYFIDLWGDELPFRQSVKQKINNFKMDKIAINNYTKIVVKIRK